VAHKSDVEKVKEGSVIVKIYTVRRGNRKIYSVANYYEGKRKIQQFADYKKAKEEARKIARKLNEGQHRVLSLSNDDAWIYARALEAIKNYPVKLDAVADEWSAANKILDGVASIQEAVRFYVKRHGRVTMRTVPEIVTEFIEQREHKSEQYLRDLKFRLGKFKDAFGGYIANISSKEMAEWLYSLGGHSRSQDNYRRVIVTLFRFAVERGYLPEGKTEAEKLKISVNDDSEIEIFTPDEMQRLLDNADKDVLPYLVLGAFAGIRTAEITRMEWPEINFVSSYIEIKKSKAKTKGRRLIQMQPNLVAWLKKIAKTDGLVSPLVRPEKTASEVVGAMCNPVVKWKKNGLRHSFCSYRYAILQNEHQVSAEMGNSPQMVFANYRELVTKEDAQKWFNIFPK
jgi:integrase